MVIYSIRYHPFCNLLLMGNYAASGSSPLWEIGECENWWKLLMNLFSLSLAIFFNYRDAIKSTSPFTALDCARNCGGDSGSLVMFLIDPGGGWRRKQREIDYSFARFNRRRVVTSKVNSGFPAHLNSFTLNWTPCQESWSLVENSRIPFCSVTFIHYPHKR